MKCNGFKVEVIRTTKVDVNEKVHNLPPHNGAYPEYKVADYHCPEEWSQDGVFIPVKEGDPLWFDFRGNDECAILCAVQRVNPVTGLPADLNAGLSKDPAQNYLKMPEQRWLDGYSKEGKVYQFVVTKAGVGLAVNEYVLPKYMQDSHALGFAFFGPKNPKPKVEYKYVHHYSPYYYSSAIWSDYGGPLLRSSGGIIKKSMASFHAGSSGAISCNSLNSSQPIGAVDYLCDSESISDSIDDYMSASACAPENEAVDLRSLEQASMGMGGRIEQRIHTDENTTDYYKSEKDALLTIYFALPEMFEAIMKNGLRQDLSKKDRYVMSGDVAGVPVPLIA